MEQIFLTTGQVAKKLRISISTLKRWLLESDMPFSDYRNVNGWRLFTQTDLTMLRDFKRNLRKKGKRFNNTTLIPVYVKEKIKH